MPVRRLAIAEGDTIAGRVVIAIAVVQESLVPGAVVGPHQVSKVAALGQVLVAAGAPAYRRVLPSSRITVTVAPSEAKRRDPEALRPRAFQ